MAEQSTRIVIVIDPEHHFDGIWTRGVRRDAVEKRRRKVTSRARG
jgi:hypothetical protein